MQIQHTAILVSDLDSTKSFYEDGLNLEYAWDFYMDNGVHNYYVTGDGLETWLQFIHDPESDEPLDTGFGHLGLQVDDVDETFNHVVETTDCPVVREPTTVDAADTRVAFVKDPDGYEVEFFNPLV